MPEFPPITHIALTVADLETSVAWYGRLLGTEPVLDEDEPLGRYHHTVFLLGGGQLIGLHQHEVTTPGSFDERRAGLDHLAFACANRGELESWEQQLNELGIAHGGIVDAPYGSGLSFRDPDGIALEFFAPPS